MVVVSITGKNRVAIITGAIGTLASELVMVAAQSGWETVLIDKDQKFLENLYDRITAAGGVEPSIHVLDFAIIEPRQCQDMVMALENSGGRLDAIVHCAVSFDGLQPLDQIAPHDWVRQIQVNLNAPWLINFLFLPLLRQSPQASLYFLSEDLNKVAMPFWGAYGVSKHAVDTLASQLAAELSNTNIQALSVNPGPIRSPLRARVFHTESPGRCKDAAIPAAKIMQLMDRTLKAPTTRVNLESL